MNRKTHWKTIPVWRCPHATCGIQWATWEDGTTCPSCHIGLGESTGFTCGDVDDAAEKFGFTEDFPVLRSEPVPELVQLSTLPISLWIGLPVFHPCRQQGNEPSWLTYDVGVILEVYPDPDFEDEFLCRFVMSMGQHSATLHYSPSNLWVPRSLAERFE
jgi:hypothetical protein